MVIDGFCAPDDAGKKKIDKSSRRRKDLKLFVMTRLRNDADKLVADDQHELCRCNEVYDGALQKNSCHDHAPQTANPVVQRELRMTCVDDVDYGGYSSIASDGTAAKTEELEATP